MSVRCNPFVQLDGEPEEYRECVHCRLVYVWGGRLGEPICDDCIWGRSTDMLFKQGERFVDLLVTTEHPTDFGSVTLVSKRRAKVMVVDVRFG